MQVKLSEITNYLAIHSNLASAGQPTEQQLAVIKGAGFDILINLALIDSPNALDDEADSANKLGMAYHHIPVIWEKPTKADLAAFFAVLKQNADKKIFVHCVLNMRVSVFIYLYRVLALKHNQDTAYQDVLKIWEPNEVWRSFIKQELSDT